MPLLERLTGRLTWIYAIRLMVSIGVAAVAGQGVTRLPARSQRALDAIADAVKAGVMPSGATSLPSDPALRPVTDTVRAVLGVIASPGRPPATQPAAAAAP
jgi:hypothetical protein